MTAALLEAANEALRSAVRERMENTDPADPTPEPPWYDPGLPQLTEEPGLDFHGAQMEAAGTNELMSYARRRWISIAHWERVRTQVPV